MSGINAPPQQQFEELKTIAGASRRDRERVNTQQAPGRTHLSQESEVAFEGEKREIPYRRPEEPSILLEFPSRREGNEEEDDVLSIEEEKASNMFTPSLKQKETMHARNAATRPQGD